MNQLRHALTPMRAWLLALLLLAAQCAGLAHRVSHPQPAGALGQLGYQVQKAATAKLGAVGFINGDHQSGSADCRLFDQLLHTDALCVGAAVLAALPPATSSASGPAASAPRAAAAALYLARAPPQG